MAAIAEALVAIVGFIFEMLAWSFVGFWKLCCALFSKTSRIEVLENWRKGPKDRVAIVARAALWVTVFIVGFGVGLPLAYRVLRGALENEEQPDVTLEGIAEITIAHPRDPEKELVIRLDRRRISEMKDTKDLPELVKKLQEVSDVATKARRLEETPASVPRPTATESLKP